MKFVNRQHAELFQWDTNIQILLECEDTVGLEVHFTNDGIGCYSQTVPPSRIVTIPNILLQDCKPITLYYFKSDTTTETRRTTFRETM